MRNLLCRAVLRLLFFFFFFVILFSSGKGKKNENKAIKKIDRYGFVWDLFVIVRVTWARGGGVTNWSRKSSSMCLSISWDCLRALGSECVLYFSEKRREGEWISFSPRSLGGGTVHVNLSHSVNVFSSSPPPSLHTLSGVFLGFGKFFVCVCVVFFFFFCCRSRSAKKYPW